MVLEHVCKLSSDVEKMTFESQKEKEEMNNLMMMPHNVQLYLQQCKKRFEKIENNMSHLTGNLDVLQHDQCFNSVKIDELTKNQHVLQQQHNSAAVKIDQLSNNQDVLQQELSSTIDEVEQLQTSQKAAQQSVTEGKTSSCSNILLI